MRAALRRSLSRSLADQPGKTRRRCYDQRVVAYPQSTGRGHGRGHAQGQQIWWRLAALALAGSLLAPEPEAAARPQISRGKLTIRRHGRNIPRDHVEFPPLRLAGRDDGMTGEPATDPTAATTGEHVPTPTQAPSAAAPATAPAATDASPATPPVGGSASAENTPAPSPTATESATSLPISCRPASDTGEAAIRCSDGKTWTMRSAGLILPPVLRCSAKHPECCQIGFRKLRDVQLADLLRVGEGQAPVCYMRVSDFLTHPPSPGHSTASDPLDDELPPGLRVHKDCPKGRYLAQGSCHDPAELMRALRRPPVIDRNRTLVPEANDVVERMRRDFDQTGTCPQAALDIEVLKRIYNAAQLRLQLVADTPLDVEPLIALASSPGGTGPEPQLPASCGYNATYQKWFQTTFHCATQQICFAQSHSALPHTCAQFQRATTQSGTSPYFWPWANCQNVPFCSAVSSASIECTGVARLTALGRGVYLMIQEDTAGAPYYYGVLFARARARSDEENRAAKRARGLLQDMARNLPSASERSRMQELLSSLPE